MIVKGILFPLDEMSTSGTYISTEIYEEYAKSDDCKDAVERGLMTGGLTHLIRQQGEEYVGKVGIDDNLLLDGLIVHKILHLWRDGKNVCFEAKILNENFCDPVQAEQIKRLKGLLRNDVIPPISVVVDTILNKSKKAEKLVAIVGFDWTFNPAFKVARILEIILEEEDVANAA